MAHGRNTTVVSIRFTDSVCAIIKRRADKAGMTMGDWIKLKVIQGQHIHSVNANDEGVGDASDVNS